jgi:outer membrane protein TolC
LAELLFFAVVGGVFVGGCISEEAADYGEITAYQQQQVSKAPQQRAGEEGLGALTPQPEPKLAELQVVTDAKTGKKRINLTIEEAITRTLLSSPEIQVVSFEPQISKEELTKEVAAFDRTIFGRYDYSKDDEPLNSTTLSDIGLTRTRVWQAGVKQKAVTGSELSFTWALTRTWDDLATRRFSTRYEPMLTFQIKQPLLRDGWRQLNLAGVNVARMNYEISFTGFREQLENVASQVIKTYWTLLQSRRDSQIQQWLLEKTVETLTRVLDRKDIDATTVHIKQIESSVESRRAALFETQKRIIDVQDSLARLLSDAQINVLDDSELVPVTEPKVELVNIDTFEAVKSALQNSPTIQQNRLKVDVAQINLDVSRNQSLPRLDIVASADWLGFAEHENEAHEKLFNDSQAHSSYAIGVTFEYPLGNRQRRAEVRRRRLELSMAVSNLQNISDKVAIVVKEKIRKVETSHRQMQAQTAALKAANIHLDALEDSELIRGKLTPEFLQVKLQAQANMANAEQGQIKAVVDFNIALVELAQATGTVLQLHHVQAGLK